MADSIRITAPATSANLGPGFDTLALALDFTNEVIVTRRPGPLEVVVTGEGADELPADETNLVCRAMASGLGSLDGLRIECANAIPLRSGLGSSAAAACSGLVAANALGLLRWTPDEMVRRGGEFDGHLDNVAACAWGGIVAATGDGQVTQLPIPEELLFVVVTPAVSVSTESARASLPAAVPYADAATSLANAVTLALMIERGQFDEIDRVLGDRLHEPYREEGIPGLALLRGMAGTDGCLGATISDPVRRYSCGAPGAVGVGRRRPRLRAPRGRGRRRHDACSPHRTGRHPRTLDRQSDTRLAKAVG